MEIAYVAIHAGFDVVGFLDNLKIHNSIDSEFPFLGSIENIKNFLNCEVVVAIGCSQVRKQVVNQIEKICNPRYATIIHPTALLLGALGEKPIIGSGSVLFPYVCISRHVAIGEHSILNTKSSVGLDSKLGNFITLSPAAIIHGSCVLADTVEVGAGSMVIQNVKIDSDIIIGAGTVVVESLDEVATYSGIPAKKLTYSEKFHTC